MARIASGFISCRLPDRYPRLTAHRLRLDQFIHTPPHPARILRGNRLYHGLHFIIDLGLYGFWGFRLDATPVFYFFSSPKDAMASVSFWFVLLGILSMLIYAAILYFIFYCVLIREKKPLKIPYRRQNVSLALLLLTAALFIPIRGGFSVSTMNLSKVYFSQDQRMNHAAINPAFSFMYSATHQNNFDKQYRFMDPKIADELFAEMVDKPVAATDSIPQLLNTQRPNIILLSLRVSPHT